MCLKTNIDERMQNLGFVFYAENLIFVFFHQYLSSNTIILKILAEVIVKLHPFSHN